MRLPIIVVLVGTLCLAACGRTSDGDPAAASGGLQVVAGFYPLAEAAAEIGGDAVEVVNLTPAGAEAHDLELTPGQLDTVLDADLVLMLGEGFQPALEAAVARRDGPTLDLLDRSDQHAGSSPDESDGHDEVAGDHAHGHEPGGDAADPHVWLDPRQFAGIAHQIGDAIERLVPEPDRAGVRERAAAYEARLAQLDLDFEAGLKRCQRRQIVTTHAAFGHLAAAYGLRQESISGLSPGAEPEPRRLTELAELVRRTGTTTIFVEPFSPVEAAEVLGRESGARTTVLHPLEGLTSTEAETGEDYESVMRTNLAALREGLECG